MIVSPDGTIVTNNHVVAAADTIKVTIPGHGVHVAVVVGTDPTLDVAVLRVPGVSGLPTVKFASSASAAVGDPAVAIPSSTVTTVAREIGQHANVPGLVLGRQAFLGVEVVDASQLPSGPLRCRRRSASADLASW